MADKKHGIKSSVEIALERMGKSGGEVRFLSGEQKAALAEIESQAKAKIAELEIMMTPKIQALRAGGDFQGVEKLESEHRAAVARIREHAESDKERVRTQA